MLPINKSLPTNGHLSPLANTVMTNDDAPYESDSDLSDIQAPAVGPSPSSTTSERRQSEEFGNQDISSSESSEPENQDGSDDGDFDMEESPAAAQHTSARHDRSTSPDSRRPTKRKMGFEDDEHIMANPELYGLRRSVGLNSQVLIRNLTWHC